MKNLKLRIARNVIIAVLIVIAINFLVLYYLNFPLMAMNQLSRYLPLLILLIAGFGVQIGLMTYSKHKSITCGFTTTASGGISSVSMILCCSHYLLAIFPFMGVSSATFITKYTLQILLIGVISSAAGIFIVLNKIRKSHGGKK